MASGSYTISTVSTDVEIYTLGFVGLGKLTHPTTTPNLYQIYQDQGFPLYNNSEINSLISQNLITIKVTDPSGTYEYEFDPESIANDVLLRPGLILNLTENVTLGVAFPTSLFYLPSGDYSVTLPDPALVRSNYSLRLGHIGTGNKITVYDNNSALIYKLKKRDYVDLLVLYNQTTTSYDWYIIAHNKTSNN